MDDEPLAHRAICRELRPHFDGEYADSGGPASSLLQGTGAIATVVTDLHLGAGQIGVQLLPTLQWRGRPPVMPTAAPGVSTKDSEAPSHEDLANGST